MTTAHPAQLRTQFRTIDGLSIRFAESGERNDHALLLNPWPESLFAYQPTWSRLAEHAHLVAIDLPGFGHSEGRDSLFSPQAMGEFIIRAADAFGMEQPHIVGPDIGTSASLFAAAQQAGRFRSLIVGSGATAFPLQIGGELKEWIDAPDLERYRALDARAIVARVISRLEHYTPSAEAREDYLSSYEGYRFVSSMQYVRRYPTELRLLGELLPGIATPVQIFAGRRDTIIPLENAEYPLAWLPNSKLDVLDAGHFAWEDAANEFSALVTSWWGGGYRTTSSIAATELPRRSSASALEQPRLIDFSIASY